MPRKPKKGYFVRGHFVTEGSELDIELKSELRGTDGPSKTDLKRESDELQALGEALLTLPAARLEALDLDETLTRALAELRKISNFEGRRRQLQFIGKRMRKLDEDTLMSIRQSLEDVRRGPAAETAVLHEAERWRDRLIESDDAIGGWIETHAVTDTQALRALVRQARKDLQAGTPGEAPRQGKAYRELFQLVRRELAEHADDDRATEAQAQERSNDA